MSIVRAFLSDVHHLSSADIAFRADVVACHGTLVGLCRSLIQALKVYMSHVVLLLQNFPVSMHYMLGLCLDVRVFFVFQFTDWKALISVQVGRLPSRHHNKQL